jgi:ATPase subunit of ABC transporter with duplicated ATPase domains
MYLGKIDTYRARGLIQKGCSVAREHGGYSVWNRQEALRLQRQLAAAEKAAERERKLHQTAVGKASAEQLNADLAARVTRLESILQRGLNREAAINLNAMIRQDQFPPLDLGPYRAAAPRPMWSTYAPPRAGFDCRFLRRKVSPRTAIGCCP